MVKKIFVMSFDAFRGIFHRATVSVAIRFLLHQLHAIARRKLLPTVKRWKFQVKSVTLKILRYPTWNFSPRREGNIRSCSFFSFFLSFFRFFFRRLHVRARRKLFVKQWWGKESEYTSIEYTTLIIDVLKLLMPRSNLFKRCYISNSA